MFPLGVKTLREFIDFLRSGHYHEVIAEANMAEAIYGEIQLGRATWREIGCTRKYFTSILRMREKERLLADIQRLRTGFNVPVTAINAARHIKYLVKYGDFSWEELETTEAELTELVRLVSVQDLKRSLDSLRRYSAIGRDSVRVTDSFIAEIRTAVANGTTSFRELGTSRRELRAIASKAKKRSEADLRVHSSVQLTILLCT